MGQLSLALLGTPEILHDGQILSFPTRKALALLVYLAVEGGRHSREKLATLFWPDSDAENSRAVLRRTLAFARDALGDRANRRAPSPLPASSEHGTHLVVDRDVLAFDFDSDHEIDLQAVQMAWSLTRSPAIGPTAEAIRQLQRATSRYRGEFLEGFSLSDAPAFDDWVSLQREAWHRRMMRILDRLTQWQSDGGDLLGAIETTAHWIAHDPLNEIAHRRLMRLHFANGDLAAALDAYEACRARLGRELNAEPAPETEALAGRLRAATPPRRRRPRSEEGHIRFLTGEAPLVGRVSEHAQLVAAYRTARRGQAQGVVIAGESGIGKTRLATEFLGWAKAQGADVLQGRAIEAGGRLPYQPLLDAIRGRLVGEDALDSLLGAVWLGELSRLLPELRERLPHLPPPLALPDAEARTHLSEAVVRLGQALGKRASLVLLVDDLQWADAGSLDLLQYAAQRWTDLGVPVLLTVNVRSEDLATNAELTRWLSGLGRVLPLTYLTLGPLGAEDTLQLVRSLGTSEGERPSRPASTTPDPHVEAFAQWLFHETRGHPFYVTETVKSLLERQAAREEALGNPIALPDVAKLRGFLPSSVRQVIQDRIARLSPPARATLTAASVLGHGFDFECLCAVTELSEEAALPVLDELLGRRLLDEVEGQYSFSHDKLREVAYAETSEARRRMLHRRSLEVLEATNTPATELVRHALASGQTGSAIRYSIAAGDEAFRLFAVRDAIEHYERARELLKEAIPGQEGPPNEREINLQHLYTQLGRAYELATEYDKARPVYEALLAHARRAQRPELECIALNHLATLTIQDSLDLRQAAGLLQSARAIAESSGDKVGLARTEWNLAQVEMYRGELKAARQGGRRALALARELHLSDDTARALNQLAYTELFSNELPSTALHAAEARALYASLGNRAMEIDCLCLLAQAKTRFGRPNEGLAAAREALEISEEIENDWGRANSTGLVALALLEQGELERALDVARAGVAAARLVGFVPLLVFNLAILGSACRALFITEAALEAHDEAYREAEKFSELVGHTLFVEIGAAHLCADYAVADDWASAHTYARKALDARSYSIVYAGLTRWCETEALVCAGDATTAIEDVRRFGEEVGDNPRYRIPYLRALAVLAAASGKAQQAIEHLTEARHLADGIGLPGELWQIEAALAKIYAATGDDHEARNARVRAVEIVQRLANAIDNRGLRTSFLAAAPVRKLLENTPDS